MFFICQRFGKLDLGLVQAYMHRVLADCHSNPISSIGPDIRHIRSIPNKKEKNIRFGKYLQITYSCDAQLDLITFPDICMVLILDGNSEHVAHAYMKIGLYGANALNRSNNRDARAHLLLSYHLV